MRKNLQIIFIQALLAMSGSLYFSNFGDPVADIQNNTLFVGPGFEPCHLCWWTRILMYPLVRISLIALIRKDYKIIYIILPVSFLGMCLSAYHYTIQHINSLSAFTCNPDNPCTTIDWSIFNGVITIPALAFIGFTVIFIQSLMIIYKLKKEKQLTVSIS